MRANLDKRAHCPRNRSKQQQEEDLVLVGHQWLHEDGTPASEYIEHWIPNSR
jgi:hypothetical protein